LTQVVISNDGNDVRIFENEFKMSSIWKKKSKKETTHLDKKIT
jgi:hypothetical protein